MGTQVTLRNYLKDERARTLGSRNVGPLHICLRNQTSGQSVANGRFQPRPLQSRPSASGQARPLDS